MKVSPIEAPQEGLDAATIPGSSQGTSITRKADSILSERAPEVEEPAAINLAMFSERMKKILERLLRQKEKYCNLISPLACEGVFWLRDHMVQEESAAFESAVAFDSETAYRPIAFPDRYVVSHSRCCRRTS